MRLIKNSCLIITSLIIALIITEASLRLIFPHTPTFESYFPRYVVDGNPSYVSGMTRKDDYMPFSMNPNYSHTLTDLAYHPKPYRINLNNEGYRNTVKHDRYDNVIVGDSVAYGSGVDDDQTVAAILGKSSKVYSLAISGAGPAMYMKMIDSFLKKHETDKITIIFFLGNDLRNIKSACWDELKDCKPPLNSKISRKDVSANPSSPSLFMSKPVIRNSYFAHFVFMFINNIKNRHKKDETSIADLHTMISRNAIVDIRNYIDNEYIIKQNKRKAMSLLAALLEADCVNDKIKILITEAIDDLKADRVEDIFKKIKNITTSFIDTECYPIDKNMQNLVINANYHAGFFYESINAVKNGYMGNIYNYSQLLKMISRKYTDLNEDAKHLSKLLLEMKDQDKIGLYSESLQRKLKSIEKDRSCNIAENCDKLDIFFKYLVGLEKLNTKVALYLLPSEYQIKRRLLKPNKPHFLQEKATSYGLKCLDLSSKIIEHYKNNQNNAIYIDGAHLSKQGNKIAADWIMENEKAGLVK